MKIRTAATVTFAAALISLIAIGCSSSTSDTASNAAAGNCPAAGAAGPCPKDDAITKDGSDKCNAAISDAKCGADAKAFLKCQGSKLTCGSDMKTDGAKLLADCKAEQDAYGKCLTSKAGDAG